MTSHHRFLNSAFLTSAKVQFRANVETETFSAQAYHFPLSSLLNSSQNEKTRAICTIKANET